MTKTTVYLPDDLKSVVSRLAAERKTSEADVIREAIRRFGAESPPKPKIPLFRSNVQIAERVDEMLRGFGER